MTPEQQEACFASLAKGSKTFSLASRIFPKDIRVGTAAIYAYCRRADDMIDLVPPNEQPAMLSRLRSELDLLDQAEDDTLQSFAWVHDQRHIPLDYAQELLNGFESDVANDAYDETEQLMQYAYRVAGTVGLMMCHVMGIRSSHALRHAAHLGMAMQLTNICRDVAEDWDNGRLYIPDSVLRRHGGGGLYRHRGESLPDEAHEPVRQSVAELLALADKYYQSGFDGVRYLRWQCAFAIRGAARMYRAIGGRLQKVSFDPFLGRAFVPKWQKFGLLSVALLGSTLHRFRRDSGPLALPQKTVRFPYDVLPI